MALLFSFSQTISTSFTNINVLSHNLPFESRPRTVAASTKREELFDQLTGPSTAEVASKARTVRWTGVCWPKAMRKGYYTVPGKYCISSCVLLIDRSSSYLFSVQSFNSICRSQRSEDTNVARLQLMGSIGRKSTQDNIVLVASTSSSRAIHADRNHN